RAGAGDDQPYISYFLVYDFQAIQYRSPDDDRGAVLVVVEHRDLHARAQLALHDEALGRLDVLQVDAAEGRLEARDDVDQLVRIALVDLDVEAVDAGEFLEENRLAFHHRLCGERADRAEAQHRRAVGDHRDQVGARGEIDRLGRVAHDLLAGDRHAGRIGEREVALVDELLGGVDRDLAGARQAVVLEGTFPQLLVHRVSSFSLLGSGKNYIRIIAIASHPPALKTARRVAEIQPFVVMDVLARAHQLEA